MKNLFFLLLICLFGCQNQVSKVDIEHHTNTFFKESGLDKRTTYFDVSIIEGAIVGEAQSEGVINDFISYLDEHNVDIEANLNELVTQVAYIRNSVSNSRSQPKHSAELSTQYLMGQEVKVIKKEDGWLYIQGPDNYLSWMDAGGLLFKEDVDKEWLALPKVTVQVNEYAAKTNGGDGFGSDLVFGNRLAKKDTNTYLTPDGTELTIQDNLVTVEHRSDINQVINKALSLMGRPYLWGGTSTKGMDCSGFTRTAFMNANHLLGRDASLQVKEGEEVDVNNREEWKKGDLLFFGNIREDGSHRITHVAIHLKNGKMVHASERVRIESINPASPIYNQARDESLLQVRRILK